MPDAPAARRARVLRSHLLSPASAAAPAAGKKKGGGSSKAFADPNWTGSPLTAAALMGVSGKVALVTGGSKGIGKMIAAGLVQNGAKVYVCARKAELCEEAAKELNEQAASAGSGGSALPLPGDLGTEKGCIAVADALRAKEERLHLLFNNAGATWGAPLEKYPDEAWQKVMDLNVRSVFNLTVKCLPMLKAAATPADPARVVIISSIDGIRATQTFGPTAAFAYTVSKGAAVHLTKVLMRALAPKMVTVNCICPGVFPSNMTAFMMKSGLDMSSSNPLKRVGDTEDMAALAVYLSGRGSKWLNGAVIPIDGGAHLAG